MLFLQQDQKYSLWIPLQQKQVSPDLSLLGLHTPKGKTCLEFSVVFSTKAISCDSFFVHTLLFFIQNGNSIPSSKVIYIALSIIILSYNSALYYYQIQILTPFLTPNIPSIHFIIYSLSSTKSPFTSWNVSFTYLF